MSNRLLDSCSQYLLGFSAPTNVDEVAAKKRKINDGEWL
jgi:hypothetical protein